MTHAQPTQSCIDSYNTHFLLLLVTKVSIQSCVDTKTYILSSPHGDYDFWIDIYIYMHIYILPGFLSFIHQNICIWTLEHLTYHSILLHIYIYILCHITFILYIFTLCCTLSFNLYTKSNIYMMGTDIVVR